MAAGYGQVRLPRPDQFQRQLVVVQFRSRPFGLAGHSARDSSRLWLADACKIQGPRVQARARNPTGGSGFWGLGFRL